MSHAFFSHLGGEYVTLKELKIEGMLTIFESFKVMHVAHTPVLFSNSQTNTSISIGSNLTESKIKNGPDCNLRKQCRKGKAQINQLL